MKDLTKYKNDLFGDRGTDVVEALTFAYRLIDTLPKRDRLAALTAMMVVVNTMVNASEIETPKERK
jgi:hypothetical protein